MFTKQKRSAARRHDLLYIWVGQHLQEWLPHGPSAARPSFTDTQKHL